MPYKYRLNGWEIPNRKTGKGNKYHFCLVNNNSKDRRSNAKFNASKEKMYQTLPTIINPQKAKNKPPAKEV